MLQTAQKRRRNGLGLCIYFQGSVSFRLNEQAGSSQCQSFLLPPKEDTAHNIHLCLFWCFAEKSRCKWMLRFHNGAYNSARTLVLLVIAVSWGLHFVLQGLCFNEVTWYIWTLRILKLLETEVYTLQFSTIDLAVHLLVLHNSEMFTEPTWPMAEIQTASVNRYTLFGFPQPRRIRSNVRVNPW